MICDIVLLFVILLSNIDNLSICQFGVVILLIQSCHKLHGLPGLEDYVGAVSHVVNRGTAET